VSGAPASYESIPPGEALETTSTEVEETGAADGFAAGAGGVFSRQPTSASDNKRHHEIRMSGDPPQTILMAWWGVVSAM